MAAAIVLSSEAGAQENARNSYAATRVLFGRCISQQRAESVGATLLTFGISRAFNLVSGILKNAGQDEVVTYTGTGNAESSADDLPDNCIIVIRGRFAANVSSAEIAALRGSRPPWAALMELPGDALANLATNHNVYLVSPPDFMFEGLIVRSSNRKAFTLRPLYATLNSPYRSSVLGGNRRRHIALAVSFVPPTAAFDADTNPGTEVILGELERRRPLRFQFGDAGQAQQQQVEQEEEVERIGPVDSEQPGPSQSNAPVVLAGPYRQQPLESRWFPIEPDTVAGPFTVRVVVSETRSGSALARFLSEAFEEVRPELEQQTRNRLIRSERDEARIAELNETNELEGGFVTAMEAALTALNACAGGTNESNFDAQAARLQLASAARASQITANAKAVAANRAPPFADSVLVPLSGGAGIPARCGQVRDDAMRALGG